MVEVGDNLDWQGVVVQIHLFCTAGIRKEGIAVGPDEVHGPRKFSLHELTYRHKGKLVRTPTMELCATFGVGDGTYLTPVPCKNDQQGTKYGNNPIPSDYHPTRTICFAREMVKYELMRGAPALNRKQEPLILAPATAASSAATAKGVAPGKRAWTKRGLDAFFKAHAGLVVAPSRLVRLTVHSWRVWLACSLLAAGATPEQIMLLLRWSSDEARKLYARMSTASQVSQLNAACEARFDSIRSHTLLRESVLRAEQSAAEEAADEASGLAIAERREKM